MLMQKNMYGSTPLHMACNIFSEEDGIKAVQVLLEAGANPNIENLEKKTPADCARRGSDLQRILTPVGRVLRLDVTVTNPADRFRRLHSTAQGTDSRIQKSAKRQQEQRYASFSHRRDHRKAYHTAEETTEKEIDELIGLFGRS